jgi:hypothetical protein
VGVMRYACKRTVWTHEWQPASPPLARSLTIRAGCCPFLRRDASR